MMKITIKLTAMFSLPQPFIWLLSRQSSDSLLLYSRDACPYCWVALAKRRGCYAPCKKGLKNIFTFRLCQACLSKCEKMHDFSG